MKQKHLLKNAIKMTRFVSIVYTDKSAYERVGKFFCYWRQSFKILKVGGCIS